MSARTKRHTDPKLQHWLGRPLRDADFDGLRARGVPLPSVNWRRGEFDPLLRHAVVFRRGNRFDFVRHLQGEDVDPVGAFTILACDRWGAPIDVVAWHPRTSRLATWLGRTGLLGEDDPCPATREDPLRVFADVGAWLAAGRRGVVVVDERLARPVLLDAAAIQAMDIAQAEAIEAMLRQVRLPSILVPAFPHERVAA